MLCEPFMRLLPIIKTTSSQALPHTITTKHTKCPSSCSTKGSKDKLHTNLEKKDDFFGLASDESLFNGA